MLKDIFKSKVNIVGLTLLFGAMAGCSSSKMTANKLSHTPGFEYSMEQLSDDRGAVFYKNIEGLSYLVLTEKKEEHVHAGNYTKQEASRMMGYFIKTGELPCTVEPIILALNAPKIP